MRQDQLDGLVTFVCVAEHASFSAAAVRLGVSPSAVSQVIRNLERRLGVALFNRTTRSVSLTEAGVGFLAKVQPAVSTLTAAALEVGDSSGLPSGLLRLNVPRAAYLTVLQPLLSAFLAAHPQIDLELTLENALVDIVRLGFDAGIRFGDFVEQDMVAVKVGPPLRMRVIASPGYLARHGTPAHPAELLQHNCIGFRASSGVVERWDLVKGQEALALPVGGRMIVNDSSALVQSVLDGLGVGYMISGHIDPFIARGELVSLFEAWCPELPGYTLYYPDRRRVSRKLRALIDFLREVPVASGSALRVL
ncbi:LysR family transcriptional regulator [Pseudomonas tolaasii]|uniref:LysR family transcriptional regulator n=1 Tax=Pseudomonas tolaasii TaxID=29442 RepID=UPI0015A3C6DB|nr:LysR family transcriptional regulator [Pseudomonas tolaasii]NWC26800.1 LysR family transcriptional regulator [Pseudomonas tolaasii]NWC51618.1 LysR family transcriptional regulator [Pseudomonas tolaasii]NWE66486.1 LysR family transcriptional regulator [Pseudomonas tolaasii]